jgi:succinate dehydrogenase / fumarate reductase membrane anchor subunit
MLKRLYGGARPSGGGFETFSWYYFRASGIILVLMVIAHLVIMHVTNDVSCTNYAFVAARYANPFWRLFDWLLLTITLTHGINGLRVVIGDYVREARTRLVLVWLCGLLLLAFFMLGTITIMSFHPVAQSLQVATGCHP